MGFGALVHDHPNLNSAPGSKCLIQEEFLGVKASSQNQAHPRRRFFISARTVDWFIKPLRAASLATG